MKKLLGRINIKLALLLIILFVFSSFILIQDKNEQSKTTTTTPTRSTSQKITPKPTENRENELIDCSINEECGGGSKMMTKLACSEAVCCQFKKNTWQFVDSKNDCDNLAKTPPSQRAISDATKTYTYLKEANNAAINAYTQETFINGFAKFLDWDSNALVQDEIAIQNIETYKQNINQNMQTTYPTFQFPQIPQFQPMPQYQYQPVPQFHTGIIDCGFNGVGITCSELP